MVLAGETEVLGEKPVQLPVRSQISHGLARAGTQSSVARGRRQRARPMARPLGYISYPEFYVTVEFVPRCKHSASVNV